MLASHFLRFKHLLIASHGRYFFFWYELLTVKNFFCFVERVAREEVCGVIDWGTAMVYVEKWKEFAEAAEALFVESPSKV